MKKYFYPLILATALTSVACSDEEKISDLIEEEVSSGQKEEISFTVSDLGAGSMSAGTRAGFVDKTQIVARFESKHETKEEVRTTRTVLIAEKDAAPNTATFSLVDYYKANDADTSNKRYWDDAFGRNANISVYAVAVPTKVGITNKTKSLSELVDFSGSPVSATSNPDWNTGTPNNTIMWYVETGSSSTSEGVTTITGQTKLSIDNEDLCYSNNIQSTPATEDKNRGKYGRYVYDFTLGDDGKEKGYPANTGVADKHADGPLKISLKTAGDKTANGKFDKGHLIFEHALSRITVTLNNSSEYSGSFKFSNGNIKLLGMNVSGTLDIKTGLWNSETIESGDILKMAPVVKNSSGALVADDSRTVANGTYLAQMLPGYVFEKDKKTVNVMEFTIDNNTYYITQADLFKSLNDNAGTETGKNGLDKTAIEYTMEMGKNYVFNITLNKAKIENITATVADWVEVVAEEIKMDNSHVEFSFLSPTGTNCTEINFYRLAEKLSGGINTTDSYTAVNFSGDYKTGGVASIEVMKDDNDNVIKDSKGHAKYGTAWYYENNETAYHFRTLNNLAANEGATEGAKDNNIKNTTDDPAKSYFTMTADATTKDYHWGAPMNPGTAANPNNLAYSPTDGFKASLHKGVTSTTSDITIQELHMMSNLNIVLKTSTGDDKVDLTDATITLTNLATSATVDMGTGLITPAATISATQETTAPSTYWADGHSSDMDQTNPFTCAVIPQPLVRETGTDKYIGITITTSDKNQYYVIAKLSDIIASTVSNDRNQEQGEAITRWYPNHTYTYTFKITKKGIENITATVADWVTVTGADTNIDLES